MSSIFKKPPFPLGGDPHALEAGSDNSTHKQFARPVVEPTIEVYDINSGSEGWAERFDYADTLAGKSLNWIYRHNIGVEGDSSPLRVCTKCGGIRQDAHFSANRIWPTEIRRLIVSSCSHNEYSDIPQVYGIDSLGEWFIIVYERCKLCHFSLTKRKGQSCPHCDRALGCNYEGIGYASDTVHKVLHITRTPSTNDGTEQPSYSVIAETQNGDEDNATISECDAITESLLSGVAIDIPRTLAERISKLSANDLTVHSSLKRLKEALRLLKKSPLLSRIQARSGTSIDIFMARLTMIIMSIERILPPTPIIPPTPNTLDNEPFEPGCVTFLVTVFLAFVILFIGIVRLHLRPDLEFLKVFLVGGALLIALLFGALAIKLSDFFHSSSKRNTKGG